MNFFLGFLYTATATAAGSNISRTIPTKTGSENAVEDRVHTDNSSTSNSANRATVSRNVVRKTQNVAQISSSNKPTNVISRSVTNRKATSGATLSDGVNTVGRNPRTEAASINNNPALRRAGITLRASTAEVGGRANHFPCTIGADNQAL